MTRREKCMLFTYVKLQKRVLSSAKGGRACAWQRSNAVNERMEEKERYRVEIKVYSQLETGPVLTA